ncbi:hypothetical protein [Rhizobium mayense]|uniref:Uncharacterized protein n=1 Tax=Rhizobium mayense TaxID=1312184 RepID=A0ABT7JSW7_9HYPH|nr:hypothetical protein [Rhizobium mayense]MDL2399444.1 hypothetical protein [Rhizobium mayense]
MPMQKQLKQREKEKWIEAERWRRRRQQRERLQRLKDLAKLILLIRFLDLAKEFGAAMGALITSNLSRPGPTNVRAAVTAEAPPRPEYTHKKQPRLQLHFGRYFEQKPSLSLAVRYLELPNNTAVFQFILTQLPEETHDWARAMIAERGAREFKIATRNHTASEVETIKNMQLAAQRWQWQQDEAVRQKKLEIEKKFKKVNAIVNHDQEPDGPPGHNPRM